MSDSKKYYYLKLKDNFFETDEMILLENMQDGYLFSNILLKLYLRSLKSDGRLMYKDIIPYTPSAIAQITRHQVGTIEKALKIFQQLGLIEILDNGAIYMNDIQNFIGQSSSEGDRKRDYRNRINIEKTMLLENNGQMSGQMSDKRPPEIEIEIEKEIEKEIDIEIDNILSTSDEVGARKSPKIDYDFYANTFNLYCTDLPQIKKMSDSRKKALKTFSKNYSEEEFKQICAMVHQSDFLSGRNGKWQASFDWIIKPANTIKILEGNYKNKKAKDGLSILKEIYDEETSKNNNETEDDFNLW